jgi:hypothetical protein
MSRFRSSAVTVAADVAAAAEDISVPSGTRASPERPAISALLRYFSGHAFHAARTDIQTHIMSILHIDNEV